MPKGLTLFLPYRGHALERGGASTWRPLEEMLLLAVLVLRINKPAQKTLVCVPLKV